MKTTDLQLKLEKAEEKVEKTKKTVKRHEKQLQKKVDFLASKGIDVDLNDIDASRFIIGADGKREHHEHSWEVADASMKLRDIKGAKKKHEEAKKVAMNWRIKLENEQNKENFLEANTPQVIKDFLDEWAKLAYSWSINHYEKYQEYKKKLKKQEAELRVELGVEDGRRPTSEQNKSFKEQGLDYFSMQERKANYAGVTILHMDTIRNEEERLEWLKKTIEKEKKDKMHDLISRINSTVGTITDSKNLRVSDAGNLNGIIIGTQGKASVETVGAGGYNIQRFHYRTIIRTIED